MPCYHPLTGWYVTHGKYKGQMASRALPGVVCIETPLPCGKCIGCRLENARQWAIRCMHESELHDDNCMVTLTYDDEHLPDDHSLRPVDVQLWLKRLRKRFDDRKIKFFLAGEYGDEKKRPHYHVLLFGIDFQDSIDYNSEDSRPSVTALQETWNLGHVHVAPLTLETASYVARYCLKKQTEEIDYVDKSNGVILEREFTRMSRRPGIASSWIQANLLDTYKDDTVIVGKKKSRPPRYYDKSFQKSNGEKSLQDLKRKRLEESFLRRADNSPDRLIVRERIAKAKLALLKRRYENA